MTGESQNQFMYLIVVLCICVALRLRNMFFRIKKFIIDLKYLYDVNVKYAKN